VCSHVDEDLLAIFVLSLHHEARFWLDHSTALLVNDWLAVFVDKLLLYGGELWRDFSLHHLLVHLHELLMGEILEEVVDWTTSLLPWGWNGRCIASHEVEERVAWGV
jgi:hypothetical protein